MNNNNTFWEEYSPDESEYEEEDIKKEYRNCFIFNTTKFYLKINNKKTGFYRVAEKFKEIVSMKFENNSLFAQEKETTFEQMKRLLPECEVVQTDILTSQHRSILSKAKHILIIQSFRNKTGHCQYFKPEEILIHEALQQGIDFESSEENIMTLFIY